MKLLVPVDGSDPCLKAVDYLVANQAWFKSPPEIHLINVQQALPNTVTRHLSRDDVDKYHEDEGTKELQAARAKLDSAGLKYTYSIEVGDPAEKVGEYTSSHKVDTVVLGTRALNAVAGMLVGSVAGKIIREARAPVLLVK
jgi:nucleotide-binding universal stress UspA family protein